MKQLWKKRSNFVHIPKFTFKADYNQYKLQLQQEEKQQKFQSFLQQAYRVNQQLSKLRDQALVVQRAAIYTDNKPLTTILAAYVQNKLLDTPNQELMANTVEQIALAYKSLGNDYKEYWDVNVKELNDHSLFNVLINDILNNVYDYQSLAKIGRGLASLNIQRDDLIDQIIQRSFNILNNPQPSLLENEQFKVLVDKLFEEENINKSNDELSQEMDDLSQLVKQTQLDVFQFIEAVESIRNIYKILLSQQDQEYLKEQISLNMEMMDFEEGLIELGLLEPEELKGQFNDSLDLAFNYISQGKNELERFIHQLLKTKIEKQLKVKDLEEHQVDYGQLLLALSELATIKQERILNQRYHQITKEFQKQFNQFKNAQNLDISQAYANLGLFSEAKQILSNVKIEKNQYLQYLEICLEINTQINNLESFIEHFNLSTLSNKHLIQLSIAFAKQEAKIPDSLKYELSSRFQDIQHLSELDNVSLSRITDLAYYLRDSNLLPIVVDQQQSEFYKEIVDSFPKLQTISKYSTILQPQLMGTVYLVDSDNCSVNNELNGYMDFRMSNLQCKYLTVRQFIHQSPQQFKSIIKQAFNIQEEQIKQFNQLKNKLLQFQQLIDQGSEITEDSLNQFDIKTITLSQIAYFIKKALNQLNQIENVKSINEKKFLKQQLKQTLIELQQRSKIANIDYDLNDIINSIKVEQVTIPKWYGLSPSQINYDAQDTEDGFKASLMDTQFYLSDQYCPYPELKAQLELSGLLPIECVPNSKQQRQQVVYSFPLNWREFSNKLDNENKVKLEKLYNFLERDQKSYQPDQNDLFAVNLLNIKAELKERTVSQAVEQILSLNVWDKLLEEKVNNQKQKLNGQYLQRNGLDLLKWNINRNNSNSQSIQYLNERLKQKEALNYLVDLRNEMIDKIAQDVKSKQLNKEQAQELNNKINKMLIDKVDDVKNELNFNHTSMTYKQQVNYIDVLFDREDIEQLDIHQNYDEYLDVDILLSQGNPNKYLSIKRSRAEEKLLLYRILLKQYKKQPISQLEKQFLNHLDLYNHQISVTQYQIKDLPQSDQAYFGNFIHSNINDFSEYSLSELVLELSDLFQNQLFRDFQYKKYYNQFKITHQIKRQNSLLYLQAKEQQIWNDQQKLNPEQLADLKQMVNVPAILTWLKESIRRRESQNIEDSLDILNEKQNSLAWISKYLQAKFDEGSVNVSLAEDQEKNNLMWSKIFKCEYSDTTSEQLHEITEQLISRFYILKHYQPSFLRSIVKMILLHPNLSSIDQKNFETYQNQLQFEIDWNSQDILQLSKNKKQIEQHLVDISYPYGEQLYDQLSL